MLPCCAYPDELERARKESSYLVIRDNAIEFNNPKVQEEGRWGRQDIGSGLELCCSFYIERLRMLYCCKETGQRQTTSLRTWDAHPSKFMSTECVWISLAGSHLGGAAIGLMRTGDATVMLRLTLS